jgi:hypothetical protein
MEGILLWLAALAWQAPQADPRLQAVLARVAEEAEIFAQAATNLTSEETFQQRARKNPRRFRPRFGGAATEPPKVEYAMREIVSEYGYAVLKESPGQLHELRQVMSVDGRKIMSAQTARQALARGMKSQDDRVKRRMLEEFRRHGLASAAADFGQVILLFSQRRQGEYRFAIRRSEHIGADPALVLTFEQTGGSGALVIFEGRTAIHQTLEGELWVRQPDWLPLRVVLRSVRKRDETVIRDEATVDYVMTQHGVLAPASVVHRQYAGDQLAVENLFRYLAFRKFAAEAEVKFN